jgi:hypothetical protein
MTFARIHWLSSKLPKEPIVPDVDLAAASQFNAAFELLRKWVDIEDADEIQPLGNAAVYKTSALSHQ